MGRLRYAFLHEMEDGTKRIVQEFTEENMLEIIEEIHRGDFRDTFKVLKKELERKVRRHG